MASCMAKILGNIVINRTLIVAPMKRETQRRRMMKTETIPQDIWQRHELEWQAIRAKPVSEGWSLPRANGQREDERDGERPARRN